IPNWTIIRKLGQGGMGAVYKAVHNVMAKRVVAMKVLAPNLADNPDFVARFEREAKSAGALDHPNVVAGVDFGQTASGTPYFAMEYVDGFSAKDLLARQNHLSVSDALKIVYDVAQALQHAAESNIVHRDIKPDNIMIVRKDGTVKLADLGLAKQIGDENSMTQTGSGFGTPYYMPPEQARNAKYVDARSDIYALGATLYQLLTKSYPFNGTTAYEVIVAKETGTYAKASALNADVPSPVNLLIDKMMAKDPAHRFQSAAELVAQLDRIGLHNDRLSFIGGGGPSGAKPGGAPKSDPGKANPQQKSKTPAAPPRSSGSLPEREVAAPSDTYYLNYKDAKGNPVKTKMPKSRVLHMIRNGDLDERVEASTGPKGPFRKLAAFPEFEPFLRSRIAAKKLDAKPTSTANKMQDLIQNFDKLDSRHKLKGKAKSAVFSIFSFVFAGILFVAGCWGIYTYLIAPQLDKQAAETKKFDDETKRNKETMGS
ncbi:MAG TPA: serine/threonine-protein kinase, partial [Planctomycetia bacterium]|nr:serine/threonine-protein kinase [Planctomycetia bacterium]